MSESSQDHSPGQKTEGLRALRASLPGEARRMGPADMVQVSAIFNAAVAAGEATHDIRPRSEEQMSRWLLGEGGRYEAFVFQTPSGVAGWSAITRYHEREAYSPTVELCTYVLPSARRQGVGACLFELARRRARELRFHSAVVIVFPEPGFVLERVARSGFLELGRLTDVVEADGRWRDIVLFQQMLEEGGV